LGKKEKITEGRKAGRASKRKPPPTLAQGLDPPLVRSMSAVIVGETLDSKK